MQHPSLRTVVLHLRTVLLLATVTGCTPTTVGRLSFEEAIAPDRTAPVPRFSWAEDGRRILRRHQGEVQYLDPFTGDVLEEPDDPQSTTDAPAEEDLPRRLARELARMPRPGEAAGDPSAGRVERARRALGRARSNADDSIWVIPYEGDLYVYQAGAELRCLGTTPADERLITLAPDGSAVAFVRDQDLYCHVFAEDREVAVTTDGGPPLDGELDWVYQEEVYGRGRWRAQWWSPDGARLAYLRIDIDDVPTYTLLDHRHEVLESDVYGYPHPGEPNPQAELWVVRPGSPAVRIDPGAADGTDLLIVSVAWGPDGRVIFQVQDRLQTWLELRSAHPDTGVSTLLRREESSTWVDSPGTPRWLADGTFLWRSDARGHWRVLHCAADGTEIRTLTEAPQDVQSILRVDEEQRLLWYLVRDSRGIGSHLMRVSLDGGAPRQLTRDDGTHSVTLNHDGTFFLDHFSAYDYPPEVRLCRGDGTVQQVLASTPLPATIVDTELVSVPAFDGFPLDVLVKRPPLFDEGHPHPVLLRVYGGPAAPVFRDRWSNPRWHRFLTEQGLVVVEVNNRTSSGRGKAVHALCYRRLGELELRDYEAVAAWLGRQSWVDPSRVGIAGHSYGGFMTAYALTHSQNFRLGIASAGVYDWRHYDSIYTERFMRTPADNPDGYDESSCVLAAGEGAGHLVLIHGAMDDNVHAHNTLRMADALQKAGRRFDLMIYPGARHGLRGTRAHRYEIIWRALREHLLETP